MNIIDKHDQASAQAPSNIKKKTWKRWREEWTRVWSEVLVFLAKSNRPASISPLRRQLGETDVEHCFTGIKRLLSAINSPGEM